MTGAADTLDTQRENLLREVITNDRDISVTADDFRLRIRIGVYAYMAATYAAALATADPEQAAKVAKELADDLDDGALAELAWDDATQLGHDPAAWVLAHEQATAKTT